MSYYLAHSDALDFSFMTNLWEATSEKEQEQKVRYLHLDLVGKALPLVSTIFGRSLRTEEIDLVSECVEVFLRKKT